MGHVFTGDKPVRMDVLVDAGQTIGEALTDPARHLDVLELAIETPAVNSLLFEGESNEAMLIDLYIFEGVADSAGCRKK